MPRKRRAACANCEKKFEYAKPRLFCTEFCREEADLVRYVRRTNRDLRRFDTLVQEAIEIRIAHVLSGGYSRLKRELPASVREAVKERDEGRCQICGELGSEIDHIRDSSSDLANLQLLCRDCHLEKTQANLRPITADDPDYEQLQVRIAELKARFDAPLPLRPCDDHERWPVVWRSLLRDLS